MPIIGIIASSISKVAPDSGAMFPIAMANVGSAGTTTVTFNSIPDTYKHLQIRIFGRGTGTGNREFISARFNNDTASNYYWQGLNGSGGGSADSQNSGGAVSNLNWGFSVIPQSDAPAFITGSAVIDILEYASTSKLKVTRSFAGQDQNTTNGRVNQVSGLWNSANKITRIDISLGSGSFAQGSQVSLYGIKG